MHAQRGEVKPIERECCESLVAAVTRYAITESKSFGLFRSIQSLSSQYSSLCSHSFSDVLAEFRCLSTRSTASEPSLAEPRWRKLWKSGKTWLKAATLGVGMADTDATCDLSHGCRCIQVHVQCDLKVENPMRSATWARCSACDEARQPDSQTDPSSTKALQGSACSNTFQLTFLWLVRCKLIQYCTELSWVKGCIGD